MDYKLEDILSIAGIVLISSLLIKFTNVADNLAPVTFIDETPGAVISKDEKFLEKINYDYAEIKYHEAQAYYAQETAKRHLKIIEDIKNRIEKESEKEEK